MPLNLVNFGSEAAENDWRVFAHPLNFCIGGQLSALPHGSGATAYQSGVLNVKTQDILKKIVLATSLLKYANAVEMLQ